MWKSEKRHRTEVTCCSCAVNSGDKIQTHVCVVPKALNWAPLFQSSPFPWWVPGSPNLPHLLGKPLFPHLHGSNLLTGDSQQVCNHQRRIYLSGLLFPKIPAQRLERYNKKIWGGDINKIHVHKCRELGLKWVSFPFEFGGQKCPGSLNKEGYEKSFSVRDIQAFLLCFRFWADTLQNERIPKQKSDHETITLWIGDRAQTSFSTPHRKILTLGCGWFRLTSW